MSFRIFLLIIVVVILICLFFSSAEILLSPGPQQNLIGSVCAQLAGAAWGNENCFKVKLAMTEAQREKGLMSVDSLDEGEGMLFIFEKEAIYPFWMKNTLIPLDIIWIDSSSEVVFISQNVEPCKNLICPSVIPSAGAKYVLEINAGLCEKIGIKIGDKLRMEID